MHHEILSKEEVGVGTSTSPRDLFASRLLPSPASSHDWKPITRAYLLGSNKSQRALRKKRSRAAQLPMQNSHPTEKTPLSCLTILVSCPVPPPPPPHTSPEGSKAPSTLFTLASCSSLFFSLLSIPILSCVSAAQEVQISSTLRQQLLLLCFSSLTPNGLHIYDHSFSIPLFWPFLQLLPFCPERYHSSSPRV